jgi:hypothetical protein
MRLLSLWELRCCSRAELFGYLDWVTGALGLFPEDSQDSQDYQSALTNLRAIRWVLANFRGGPSLVP